MILREAVEQIQRALESFTPISWCTPTQVPTIAKAAQTAARSNRPRLEWTPTYPEVTKASVQGTLDAARPRLDMLAGHPIQSSIAEALDGAQEGLAAISGRDDARLTAWSVRQNGLPSADLVRRAWQILGDGDGEDLEPARYTAAELQQIIARALDHYGLLDWSVVTMSRLSTVAVDQSTRQVRIREDATFRRSDIARLLVHEVGGHVLRGVNANRQSDPTARFSLNGTATEEGLAAWLETRFQVATKRIPRIYAARTIAAHLAIDHGILPIIRTLQQAVGWSDATDIALRVKRGLTDFNNPGGYLKDQAYFAGLTQVTNHLSTRPSDLSIIMATKWPMEHLDLARDLVKTGKLSPAELLPTKQALGLEQW